MVGCGRDLDTAHPAHNSHYPYRRGETLSKNHVKMRFSCSVPTSEAVELAFEMNDAHSCASGLGCGGGC